KAERLEAWIRVREHHAEFIVVQTLSHLPRRDVHHQPHTPQVIRDDAVGRAVLYQVLRYISTGIDEAADTMILSVQFRDRAQATLIKEALHERAVHPLADARI